MESYGIQWKSNYKDFTYNDNMIDSKKIRLFWYSNHRIHGRPRLFSKSFLRRLLGVEKENYGDLLSKYLVEKISKKRSSWYRPKSRNEKRNLFAIGSILNFCDSKSVVWGSGIINRTHAIQNCDFKAVRGPLSRKRLLELGYSCPEIYGDPALLLPRMYKPKIKKEFLIGITPHVVDYGRVEGLFPTTEKIKIIDLLTSSIEKTTNEILSCEFVISSSLHGLIVAHAYNIPAIWVKFSTNLYGDDVKFQDYLQSVNIMQYTGEMVDSAKTAEELVTLCSKHQNLPERDVLNHINEMLLKVFPG